MGYKKLLHRRVYQMAGLILADFLFFGLTDPARAPSALFIVAFILVTLSLYHLFRGIISIAKWYGVTSKHSKRAATVGAAGLGSLLALQSIGQLTVRDLAVMVPLVALGYFYFAYNKHATQPAP